MPCPHRARLVSPVPFTAAHEEGRAGGVVHHTVGGVAGPGGAVDAAVKGLAFEVARLAYLERFGGE